MKEYNITLPFRENLYYLQLVKFLNFTMNLSDQEQQVLSKIIEYNIKYKVLPSVERAKFIFSTVLRKEICKDLKISSAVFSQNIIRLKNKKYLGKPVLDSNNNLLELLMIEPNEKGLCINIKFDKTITISPAIQKEEKQITEPVNEILEPVNEELTKFTPVEEEDNDIQLL